MCGAILPLCLLQAILLAVGNSQPTVLPDFSAARQRMVLEQLSAPGRDIKDRLVLDAMATVPRHEFVPETLRKFAYWDEPLPIGYGQTISQPFIVAFMTEQLNPKPTDRILEVGTGSGYQAAILSRLVAEVYTIEIIEPLAKRAEADLRRLGFLNVKVLAGDGYKGWPEHAPFDSVIVTCAPEHIPQALIDQLQDGGRLIIPMGAPGDQQLYLLRKHGAKIDQQAVLPVGFAFSLEMKWLAQPELLKHVSFASLPRSRSGRLSCNPSTGVSRGGLLYGRSRYVLRFLAPYPLTMKPLDILQSPFVKNLHSDGKRQEGS